MRRVSASSGVSTPLPPPDSSPAAVMGYTAFFGLALLGCGPVAAVFLVYTARKSFLVLLALAG